MKLRQRSKRDQALDAVASIAKTWSEWRLGERVSQTAAKGAKKASRSASRASRKASKSTAKSASGGGRRKRVKVAAAIAVVGGIGAVVAKKLTGGKAEPLYTPPAPAGDTATPTVAPVTPGLEDVAQSPTVNVPVTPPAEPPPGSPADVPPPDAGAPVAGATAGDVPAAAHSREEAGPEEPATASAGSDATPEPEDLVAESASDPEGDDVDEATERS